MSSMLRRLRERKVGQWALAYLGGGWLVLEVLDVVAEPWGVSVVAVRAIQLVVAAGFFLTLVVAWYHGDEGPQRFSGAEVLIVAGVLLIAGAAVTIVSRSGPDGAAADAAGASAGRTYLAIIPASSGPDDAVLLDGLARSLASMAARAGAEADSLWVVPATEVASQNIRSTAEARELLGVNRVLSIGIHAVGGTQQVVLTLIDPSPVRELSSITIPATTEAGFLAAASRAMASLLGLSGFDPSDFGTPSAPTAYHLYVQALGYLSRYEVEGALESATQLLGQSVALDPDYAAAHAALCEAYWETYWHSGDEAAAARSGESCDRARALGGEEVDVLIPVASVYLRRGQVDLAEQSLLDAVALDPNNADAHRWLARVYDVQGLRDLEEQEYLRAISLQPGESIFHRELAISLMYVGRLDEAAEHYGHVRALTPDNYLGDVGLGAVHMWRNEPEAARALLESSLEKRDNVIAYRNLGFMSLRAGDYDEAVRLLERGLELNASDLWSVRHLAEAHHLRDAGAVAEEASRRVMDLATSRLELNALDPDALVCLAEAHALLGGTRTAVEFLNRVLPLPRNWNHTAFYIGRTYELIGEREAALRNVLEALEMGFNAAWVDADPRLTDLTADPRYRTARLSGSDG